MSGWPFASPSRSIIIFISGFGGCHLESVINSFVRHRPEVEITFERKKILVAASLNFVCRRMSGYVGRVISESGVVENVRWHVQFHL
jgi:hypothetical protein